VAETGSIALVTTNTPELSPLPWGPVMRPRHRRFPELLTGSMLRGIPRDSTALMKGFPISFIQCGNVFAIGPSVPWKNGSMAAPYWISSSEEYVNVSD
jgi:hypothetical protein